MVNEYDPPSRLEEMYYVPPWWKVDCPNCGKEGMAIIRQYSADMKHIFVEHFIDNDLTVCGGKGTSIKTPEYNLRTWVEEWRVGGTAIMDYDKLLRIAVALGNIHKGAE